MQTIALRQRFGALCVAIMCLLPGQATLRAQPAPVPAPATSAKPEELSPIELQKSYERMQEQLRLTQSAILKNRLDAEAMAMAQTAAFAAKLDTIQSLMTAEQKRQQALADRADFQRIQEQTEMRQSNRTAFLIAGVFGGFGLLAMLLVARFQWRTINRLTESGEIRPQLPASTQSGLTLSGTGAPSGQAVTLSNQRMLSTISRMEQRIFELESSLQPFPVAKPSATDPKDQAMA